MKVSYCAISKTDFNFEENTISSSHKFSPSYIVHLAAAVPGKYGITDSDYFAKITSKLDNCIYNFAAQNHVPVIYFSGCSLYREREELLIDEFCPLKTEVKSPYLRAKLNGDHIFHQLPNSAIIRVSSPIGIGLSNNVVIQKYINSALENDFLEIWGSGDREQNFIDVRDIAILVYKVIINKYSGPLNACSNTYTTMKELANEIIAVLGSGKTLMIPEKGLNDFQYARYSNNLAREILNWQPAFSLRDSIQYVKENIS